MLKWGATRATIEFANRPVTPVVDRCIALWISFPIRRAWRKPLAFSVRQGGDKLNFDLHRSGGLWVWGLLLMLAITSVSLKLGNQIMRPLVGMLPESPGAIQPNVDQLLGDFFARSPSEI